MKTSIRFLVLSNYIATYGLCSEIAQSCIHKGRQTIPITGLSSSTDADYRLRITVYVYFTTCTGDTTTVYDSTIIQITNSIQRMECNVHFARISTMGLTINR